MPRNEMDFEYAKWLAWHPGLRRGQMSRNFFILTHTALNVHGDLAQKHACFVGCNPSDRELILSELSLTQMPYMVRRS